MHSLAPETDVRAMNVVLDDARLVVDLMDGRTIAVPLAWYPRLANATPQQRNHWQLAGGGVVAAQKGAAHAAVDDVVPRRVGQRDQAGAGAGHDRKPA